MESFKWKSEESKLVLLFELSIKDIIRKRI